MTDRQKATAILTRMYQQEIQPDEILEHLIFNFLSGKQALDAMEDSQSEFIPEEDTEEED
jgi:hypothetical protein